MKTKMARVAITLLILSTQATTIFTAEKYTTKDNRSPHATKFHKGKKSHHKSRSHKHKPRQKPENPFGAGFHRCNSGHINFGIGCQAPKGTCPEDPKSPNYRYRS